MEAADVCFAKTELDGYGSTMIMDGEIPGTLVNYHSLPINGYLDLGPCQNGARIIFLCSGSVEFDCDGNADKLSGRGVYVPRADKALKARAMEASGFVELIRALDPNEYVPFCAQPELPYCLEYSAAAKYTEECKSPKTISRMLVPQRLVPRFAMGSVETHGEDMVAKHTHPMLEQYFFGLAENNCLAMIDDLLLPFGGNELLHIPLGSDHGILLHEDHCAHYIWMDFLFDEEGLEYMDSAHRLIDENEN